MNKNVCIIGYGRLGQTLAGILKNDFTISVVETSKPQARIAKDDGFKIISLPELHAASTVIICVPISVFEQTVKDINPYLNPEALVMDTCSVKVIPTRIMEAELPSTVSIIATHPLFGPDSINRGLNHLSMVIHPVRTDDTTFEHWHAYLQNLGLNVINATPDEHDEITAYTLGMTHFFGRIMGELKLKPQIITTVGYNALHEVMTQTNNDSWQLFNDMQAYNPYAREMREQVYAAIQNVETKLDKAIM